MIEKGLNNRLSLAQLIEEKGESKITYSHLLQTKEWEERRNEILKRDRSFCTSCGLSDTLYLGSMYLCFDSNKFTEVFTGTEIEKFEAPQSLYKPKYLHVHHKFYVLGRLPWDYADEALVTLCDSCHYELHAREYVEVYEEKDGELIGLDYTSCSRCHGAGYFPEYSHVQGGVCFKCNGARYENFRGSLHGKWKY